MVDTNERLVEWLERQKALAARLEADLPSLPADQRPGQEAALRIMKEDIERLVPAAYSSPPLAGRPGRTVRAAAGVIDIDVR